MSGMLTRTAKRSCRAGSGSRQTERYCPEAASFAAASAMARRKPCRPNSVPSSACAGQPRALLPLTPPVPVSTSGRRSVSSRVSLDRLPSGAPSPAGGGREKICSVERQQPGDTYRLRRIRRETPVTTRYDNSTAAGGPNAVAKSAIYVSTGLASGPSHCGSCQSNQRPYRH